MSRRTRSTATASDATTIGKLREPIEGWDVTDLVPRATLVTMVVATHQTPAVMVACAVATVVAWPRRSLYTSVWFWLLVTLALGAVLATRWDLTDDHVWLVVYWTLGLGLAFTTSDPARTMARTGRLLLGLVFLLAAAWKIATPEFRDTTFFQFALLTDDRFEFVATSVGGVDAATMAANDEGIRSLGHSPEQGTTTVLAGADQVRPVATVFTLWGIIIESAVALAWLAPLSARHHWLRHATLLVFMFTTYLVVPVGGFAMILITLALTQTSQSTDRRWRVPLLGAAVVMLVYGPVWQALFAP